MADANQEQTSSGSGSGLQATKQTFQAKLQTNKHLVLKLHSILTWEQDYYPIVVGAATTALFLIIYLLDRSVLTTFSLLAMVVTVLDYSLPLINKSLLNTSKWTDKDTQKFDKICLDLAKSYLLVKVTAFDYMSDLKAKRPKVYYSALTILFLVLSWIGNQFNNLFLTYLIVLLVVFYPGLEKKNVPQKIFESVAAKLGKRPSIGGAGDKKNSSRK